MRHSPPYTEDYMYHLLCEFLLRLPCSISQCFIYCRCQLHICRLYVTYAHGDNSSYKFLNGFYEVSNLLMNFFGGFKYSRTRELSEDEFVCSNSEPDSCCSTSHFFYTTQISEVNTVPWRRKTFQHLVPNNPPILIQLFLVGKYIDLRRYRVKKTLQWKKGFWEFSVGHLSFYRFLF